LPGNQVEILAIVPPQMRVVNANGPSRPRIEGQRVTFPPVDALAPKQTLSYSVEVEALAPGDVRFRVELRTATLRDPVIEEESTNIYAPSAGAGPAPAPRAPAPGPAVPPGQPGATPAIPAPLPPGPPTPGSGTSR
jgi:hypothetical protein